MIPPWLNTKIKKISNGWGLTFSKCGAFGAKGGLEIRDKKYYRTDYISKITKSMESLGIYDEEFDKSIEILNDILNDLDFARKDFKADDRQYVVEYTNKNGGKNLVKNPQYQIIADLSDRALRYLNELGLTPSGLKKIKDKKAKKGKSKLDEALLAMEQDMK